MNMNSTNVDEVAKALKGMVIVGHSINEDNWGKLILLDRNTGKEYHIEPSCDPEGNAPGYLFFGEGGK